MIALGDHVRDKEYYAAGRIVGLHGHWAWLILDDDPPNARPVASQITDLELTAAEKAEAA
jgi:hypothetical protein